MYNAVKKFLALHHHLALPGVGNFTVDTKPAEVDFINRRVTPVQQKIVFNNDNLPPEKKFYNFISQELNIPEDEAMRSFTGFTSQLQDNLNTEKNIYFKGIGTLTRQNSGRLMFQSEEIFEYAPAIIAEKVIRKNATHSIRVGELEKTSVEMQTALHQPKIIKKERWQLAAAILAFIGIAAIIFYYATHT